MMSCGCKRISFGTLEDGFIAHCPLHAAAPQYRAERDALLMVMQQLVDAVSQKDPDPLIVFACIERAKAAIAKI